MRRNRAKRFICLVVAVAAFFAMLPFNAIGIVARAANASWYMDGLHSFDMPQQELVNFSSKAFDVSNPLFADGNVTEFSSNNASGWDASTATNVVMGVLNTTSFDTFKGRQEIANLNFMKVNPSSSNAGSPNVLVMANKSSTGTAAANFSQRLGEFWADGYFEVKVDFYAVGSQSAVYLIPDTDFEDGRSLPRVNVSQVSIRDTSSSNPDTTILPNTSMWQTATFIVKTDLLQAVTFKLGLYLGKHGGQAGSGVVYYDNVRVRGYSKAQFEQDFVKGIVTCSNPDCVDGEVECSDCGGDGDNGSGAGSCTECGGDGKVDCVEHVEEREQTFEEAFEAAKQDAELGRGKYRLASIVDLSAPVDPNPADIAQYSSTKQIFENFDTKSSVKFEQAENFETPDNTNVLPFVKISDIPSALNIKQAGSRVFGITNSGNSGAMLMTAVDANVSLRYSEPVVWNRNEIYMVNFYALASAESVGYFRIRDTRHGSLDVQDHIRPNLYDSGFIAVKQNSTTSSPSHNNWILNTVFVIGEALEDTETFFEFWVGGESNTTGYLMVDDFRVSRVSGAFYEKYKSSYNATECNLDWLTPTATVTNANFNSGVKRSNVSAFPLVATSWEVSVEGDTVSDHYAERRILNGIINTDEEHWRATNIIMPDANRAYGSAIRPFIPIVSGSYAMSLNNNVYMMQNVHATYQRVMSNSFSLSPDTRNVISFDAATYRLSNREVWAIIEVGEREVIRLPLVRETGSISGLSDWQNYSIVVQTSKFTGPEARITFVMGSQTDLSTGCLYIDNVRVQQSSPASGDITVDLNDPSKLYLREIRSGADVGGESLFFIPDDASTASAFYNAQADVLSISTIGVKHAVISNTMAEQLEEEKAYEYIVRLLPNVHVDIDRSYDTVNNPDWGLSLRIKNGHDTRMDGGFINLKTEDFKTMPRVNGLIELRFLVKSGTPLELGLEIEFGNESVIAQGAIGVKGIVLNEYSDDQFKAASEDTLTRIITTSTVVDDEEDSEEGSGTNLDFLIIPSLITGAAIIVAVVGFAVRRIKFKHHIGKQHTSYARDDFETNIPKKELRTPKARKAWRKKAESGEDNK